MLLDAEASAHTAPPEEAPPWPPPEEAPPWPPPSGAADTTYDDSPWSRCFSSSPPPAPGSASALACAACKHQRRKCSGDCILSPYFPGDQPEKFRNARRLFGVKNMLEILKAADPERRDACMRTIFYEANVRSIDPAHGCRGIIVEMENLLTDTFIELASVQQQLASCRETTRDVQPQSPRSTASPVGSGRAKI